MKKMVTAAMAGGFVVAFSGAGLACQFHSAAAEHNMSVAQNDVAITTSATTDETGVSTHEVKKLGDKQKAE